VVWLYRGDLGVFPGPVRRRLEAEPLAISPVVELELGYLHEVGKTTAPAEAVLRELGARLGLVVDEISASLLFRAATAITWTRDPFDRLLVAQAVAAKTQP
jgi:PIN domain nuclease of toxin-antitoxin system